MHKNVHEGLYATFNPKSYGGGGMAPEIMGGMNARKAMPREQTQAAHIRDVRSPQQNDEKTAVFEGRQCTGATS